MGLNLLKMLFLRHADYNGIMVAGNKEFIEKVGTALDLLKTKSPRGYTLVKDYVGLIVLSKKSGVYPWLKPALCEISKRGLDDVIELAGMLTHEAFHVKLYRESKENLHFRGASPSKIWGEEEVEKRAIAAQISVLHELGADQGLIDYYAKDVIKTRYWEVLEENQDW